MKTFIATIFVFASMPVFAQTDVEACLDYVGKAENYKIAHKNSHCLEAANEGNHAAQYSVGMGHGFDGRHDLEEKYYRLSAAQGNYASYMGLGHVLTDKNNKEAVYWYKRYITAIQKKPDHDVSDKYVAKLITRIYKKNNDPQELKKWLSECTKLVGVCSE